MPYKQKITKSQDLTVRQYCNLYHVKYPKYKDKIYKQLIEKENDTGDKITQTDIKEVCKYIKD